jgi:hypothetical protein
MAEHEERACQGRAKTLGEKCVHPQSDRGVGFTMQSDVIVGWLAEVEAGGGPEKCHAWDASKGSGALLIPTVRMY